MNEYRKAKQPLMINVLNEVLKAVNELEKIFLEHSLEQLKNVEKFAKVKENNGKTSSDRA